MSNLVYDNNLYQQALSFAEDSEGAFEQLPSSVSFCRNRVELALNWRQHFLPSPLVMIKTGMVDVIGSFRTCVTRTLIVKNRQTHVPAVSPSLIPTVYKREVISPNYQGNASGVHRELIFAAGLHYLAGEFYRPHGGT